ncbi:MAG TPA: tRNA pseudouridine(38-40) synthase TruA [Bacteroidota bacterium]|nr:tRNA pseudouridine(38-40) synthase TruA [Bacteroidota bacterium]
MRNIKLVLEYDGGGYVGWQRQENGTSIQGVLESVLQQILQEQVHVIGAGRTDAGVHARGQVANFHSQTRLSQFELLGALNGLLPEDVVVRTVEDVTHDFHARFSASGRRYSYRISLRPTALQRNYSWYVKFGLDIALLRRAAELILGRHDFESFCRANSDVDHYCCSVSQSGWSTDDSIVRFDICADRFLHGMVRAIVGTMVDVGRKYTSLEEFGAILASKNRGEAGQSAPPQGLVLEEVLYKS